MIKNEGEIILNPTKQGGISIISSDYSTFRILNQSIYILAEGYNGLFRASLKNGQVELIKKFLYRKNYEIHPFGMIKRSGKLIFFPLGADELAIYDETLNELYEIPLEWGRCREWILGEYAFFKERLWLFPCEDSRILEVDYEGKKVVTIIDLREIYKREMRRDYRVFSGTGCYCYDEKMFLACYEIPYLAVLDLKKKKLFFIHIPEAEKGFTALQGEGEKLYLLNANGRLMVWNIHKCQVEAFVNISEKIPGFDAVYYTYMHIVGESLFVCEYEDVTKMVNVSLRDYHVSMGLGGLSDELRVKVFNGNLHFKYFEENLLYGCNDEEQYFCIDLLSKTLKEIQRLAYNPDELKRSIRDDSMLLNKIQITIPENVFTFEELIHGNIRGVKLDGMNSQVGRCIHQILMEDL